VWVLRGAIAERHVTAVLAYIVCRSLLLVTTARFNSPAQHTTYKIMPPRLSITTFARSITLRPKPQVQWPARPAMRFSPSQCRPYSDSKTSGANDRSKKIDAQPADHVSEEAAKTAEIMGEEGPDMSRGTPVEDVSSLVMHNTLSWN
jgi:hypothetical protein